MQLSETHSPLIKSMRTDALVHLNLQVLSWNLDLWLVILSGMNTHHHQTFTVLLTVSSLTYYIIKIWYFPMKINREWKKCCQSRVQTVSKRVSVTVFNCIGVLRESVSFHFSWPNWLLQVNKLRMLQPV